MSEKTTIHGVTIVKKNGFEQFDIGVDHRSSNAEWMTVDPIDYIIIDTPEVIVTSEHFQMIGFSPFKVTIYKNATPNGKSVICIAQEDD